MISGSELHPIIENIFGDVKNIYESEQIQVCCPKCQEREGLFEPDGKYNLEINTKTKVFKCWKCDDPPFVGSLRWLIKLYGTRGDYDTYKTYSGIFTNYDDENNNVIDYELKLPNDFISFSDDKKFNLTNQEHYEAYSFLILERKINWDIIIKYNIGFCLSGRYKKRIIIPSYDEHGELNMFIGRSWLDKGEIKSLGISTYLKPKIKTDDIIFNEYNINWNHTIFIVEGGFDMFWLPNAIPNLGKTIPARLFEKIKQYKPNVVILLDPDAIINAVENYLILSTIFENPEEKIKLVKLPGNNDIDEIMRDGNVDSVIEILNASTSITNDDYFFKKLINNKYYLKNKNFNAKMTI